MNTVLLIDWISRVLGHVTWQVAVLGLVTLSFQLLLRGASPRLRHGVFMILLLAIVPCIAITMTATWPGSSYLFADLLHEIVIDTGKGEPIHRSGLWVKQPETATHYNGGDFQVVPVYNPVTDPKELAKYGYPIEASAPSIEADPSGITIPWTKVRTWSVYAYAAGLIFMTLRLIMGMYGGRRLRSRSTAVNDATILSGLAAAAERVGAKFTPAIAFCEHVAAPTVVGLLRPMILLPVSFASGLTPQQIEMILAHELAHIRRYDHWLNLIQRIVEAILFFHPAVWYISHVVRHEREICCDDIVIAAGGDAVQYADSLVRVAESARPTPQLGLSAIGSKRSLGRRVVRLLEGPEPVRLRTGRFSILIIGAIFIIGGGIIYAQSQAPTRPESNEPTDNAVALEEASVPTQPDDDVVPSNESMPSENSVPTHLAQADQPSQEESESESKVRSKIVIPLKPGETTQVDQRIVGIDGGVLIESVELTDATYTYAVTLLVDKAYNQVLSAIDIKFYEASGEEIAIHDRKDEYIAEDQRKTDAHGSITLKLPKILPDEIELNAVPPYGWVDADTDIGEAAAAVAEQFQRKSDQEAKLREKMEDLRERVSVQQEMQNQGVSPDEFSESIARIVAGQSQYPKEFKPVKDASSLDLDFPQPDLFAYSHPISFDSNAPSHSFAKPGEAPAISFRLLHHLPPDTQLHHRYFESRSPGVIGLRVYGHRFGEGYDPDTTPFIVNVSGDTESMREQAFPYSIFDTEPGWRDIIFDTPVSLGENPSRTLIISIDPNNSANRGIRIFASPAAEGSRSSVGVATLGLPFIEQELGLQWLIRAYFGEAIAPIALMREAIPNYKSGGPVGVGGKPQENPKVIEAYKRVISEYPNSTEVLDAAFMMAMTLSELDRHREVIDVVNREIRPRIEGVDHESMYANVLEGKAWRHLGDIEKALEFYRKLFNHESTTHPWRPTYLVKNISETVEELEKARLRKLLGMVSSAESPGRAETTEDARARYDRALKANNHTEAFVALNQWIFTLRIEDGRDRQTYIEFFDHFAERLNEEPQAPQPDRPIAPPAGRRTSTDQDWWIRDAIDALENSGGFSREHCLWRYFELDAVKDAFHGLRADASEKLSEAIDHYPHIDYGNPAGQSYFHTLCAKRFAMMAENSFEEAELQLLEAYVQDERFMYMPLDEIREPYEKANALERFDRLREAVIKLTEEKAAKDEDNEALRRYVEEYRAKYTSVGVPNPSTP